MEDKDLEKEAESYAQGYAEVGYDDDQIASVRDAFIDGAKWQKDHVWHKPSEEPNDEMAEILIEWTVHSLYRHDVSYYNKHTKMFGFDGTEIDMPMSRVRKWAYVKDLLPKSLVIQQEL